MNAGELDRRVTLERYTTTRDSWNNPSKTWETLAVVWAMKQDRTEVERTELNQIVALNRTLFKIRHRTDVDATMRVDYDGQKYYITGVKELGRVEGLQLTTEFRE